MQKYLKKIIYVTQRVNTYFERQNSNDFTVPNTVGGKHNTFLDSVSNTLSNKNYSKINNGLKI